MGRLAHWLHPLLSQTPPPITGGALVWPLQACQAAPTEHQSSPSHTRLCHHHPSELPGQPRPRAPTPALAKLLTTPSVRPAPAVPDQTTSSPHAWPAPVHNLAPPPDPCYPPLACHIPSLLPHLRGRGTWQANRQAAADGGGLREGAGPLWSRCLAAAASGKA